MTKKRQAVISHKIIGFSLLIFLSILIISCKEEVKFEQKVFEKKSNLACTNACPHVVLNLPIATGKSVIADSINKKVFSQMKEVIFFGENPYPAKDYNELVTQFMQSYEEIQKDYPEEVIGWEGNVEGKIYYQDESLINIELETYTFTGGAHGYGSKRSLIFDSKSGKTIATNQLISDISGFRKLAETTFRKQFNIPKNQSINSGIFMFEDDKFELPETLFYSDKGILLHYNPYEIASYADGSKEILIPMAQAKIYLNFKPHE